jgi:DNA repair photolyase
MNSKPIKGRGASDNPANRFEELHLTADEEWNPAEDRPVSTKFFRDKTQTILTYNNSPDVGFSVSVNPYRGCEHGCIYCYARPTHEYLGFSAGLDFETRIMVKEDAPRLLAKELASPKWKPEVVAMSGITDCYQPIERHLKLTRGCLEILAEFRNPVSIITKNHLVTRDIDVLQRLNEFRGVAVFVSVTTLDSKLAQRMEPRTSLPEYRLAAIEALHKAGIPVGVMVAPVLPGLTDFEMPSIIAAAAKAGAQSAGYVPLRLPFGVSALFEKWLGQHFADRKEKVLNRIRSMRGGKLNDPNFGSRMRGDGIFAEQIARMFAVACRKAGLGERSHELSTTSFRAPGRQQQLDLFDP